MCAFFFSQVTSGTLAVSDSKGKKWVEGRAQPNLPVAQPTGHSQWRWPGAMMGRALCSASGDACCNWEEVTGRGVAFVVPLRCAWGGMAVTAMGWGGLGCRREEQPLGGSSLCFS